MSEQASFTPKQDYEGYFLVVEGDGAMHCSCGRSLTKRADGAYQCDGGYPIYRPSAGDVIKDKFGNIMLKVLPHSQIDQAAQKDYKRFRDEGGDYRLGSGYKKGRK